MSSIIKVIDRAEMFPHDAAALVKVTPAGLAAVILTLKALKTPGYEVEIGAIGGERIVFKLVREIE